MQRSNKASGLPTGRAAAIMALRGVEVVMRILSAPCAIVVLAGATFYYAVAGVAYRF
jgi:hypothetical protein